MYTYQYLYYLYMSPYEYPAAQLGSHVTTVIGV